MIKITDKGQRTRDKETSVPDKRKRPHVYDVFLFTFLSIFLFNLNAIEAADRLDNQAVRINARTVEVNQKTGDTVYRGKVTIKQGNLRIRADVVKTKTSGRKAQVIKAYGNPVSLRQIGSETQGDIVATANQIQYHIVGKKITMRGNVQLHRSEDLIQSDVMDYDMVNETLIAKSEKPDTRVEAVFYPSESLPESLPGESSNSGETGNGR